MYRVCFILSISIVLAGCRKADNKQFAVRTVLVYMAADNNLYRNAMADIEEMKQADLPENAHLLVYLDALGQDSARLIEVNDGQEQVIKQYTPHNSASGTVLRLVIDDALATRPAESYGLVLWSHGTGWLPTGVYNRLKQTLSFAQDASGEMEIADLAAALPDAIFDFILFDACLMANIEVCYQLRDKSDFIIASPTETLVAGFPYTEIAPLLLVGTPRYVEIADTYMSYYKSKNGTMQSATIAVINTKVLQPLAATVKSIVETDSIAFAVDANIVQKYESVEPALFYDFKDCIEHATTDAKSREALNRQLERTIVFHGFTPHFLDDLSIEKSCGLGIFVFPNHDDELEAKYKQLEWFQDSELILRCAD